MDELFDQLIAKSSLKQAVYQQTLECFRQFKQQAKTLSDRYHQYPPEKRNAVTMEFTDRGEFAFELAFGGDVLVFLMHTNVFLFPRHDVINNTSYVKEDPNRAFCGTIQIYNFLADTFKYKRMEDMGYLIGRIFVNKEQHYFLQGKQELGRYYNNFHTSILDSTAIQNIIELAIKYTVDFDLLIPAFDEVKVVSAFSFLETLENMRPLPTGKRLGFRFNADQVDEWLKE